ncbi:MAG: Aldehyde dehydrogenase [Lentisphaerae bacterium ADurb.Bin242]|nr:MAG: Aldehyde dehydrogenase [Lentisphaerae bacterium ADurb.Bin242]
MNVQELSKARRTFFASGATLSYQGRKQALKALFDEIKRREGDLCAALHADLGKTEFEAKTTEISLTLEDLAFLISHLKAFMKTRGVPVSPLNFPARGKIRPEPLGSVLLFSAWNYPFQLLFSPLAGAVAAGNCVVVKPAELAKATAAIAREIIEKVFPPEHVCVVQGGHEVSAELLRESYDYIFYTGGSSGAKVVMRAAAEHLTPLTLELGGKSPCIVDSDAKADLAAKRIVWGKFLNAGQTCVAPDYVLAHSSIREKLIESMLVHIRRFYGEDPAGSPDYPRIISAEHCDRLAALMGSGKILCGGTVDREKRFIPPTLLTDISPYSPVMQEEIFGPILPILPVESLDEAIRFVNERPKPLALYYFSGKLRQLDALLEKTSSGGVCVNETIMHFVNPSMPFGGVGASGFGAYHGKWSFDTFTHYKGIMLKADWLDLPMRYPPNLNRNLGLLRLISK